MIAVDTTELPWKYPKRVLEEGYGMTPSIPSQIAKETLRLILRGVNNVNSIEKDDVHGILTALAMAGSSLKEWHDALGQVRDRGMESRLLIPLCKEFVEAIEGLGQIYSRVLGVIDVCDCRVEERQKMIAGLNEEKTKFTSWLVEIKSFIHWAEAERPSVNLERLAKDDGVRDAGRYVGLDTVLQILEGPPGACLN